MSKSTVILDTSCWIEFFLGSGRAASYAHHVGTSTVIVPSLCLFEVVRTLLKNFDNEHVLQAISVMQQQTVIPLTEAVAISAAQLAVNLNLSTADAVVYATAQLHHATLITHDTDLTDLTGVSVVSNSE
jgi:predicted nucleic acid-binding protein